ncbi:protein of unknown function [Pararobbsia alpina]
MRECGRARRARLVRVATARTRAALAVLANAGMQYRLPRGRPPIGGPGDRKDAGKIRVTDASVCALCRR